MLLELSQLNLELSKTEAIELLGLQELKQVDQFLIASVNDETLLPRLAYTKAAYEILFETDEQNLISDINSFKCNISGTYKISYKGIKLPQQPEINNAVYAKIKNPKVDLKRPKNHLYFIRTTKGIFCTKLIFLNTEKFEQRAAHKRPGRMPISLPPRLARCLVNLTGCTSGEIHDPFCGTGGIMIEAMLSNLHALAGDISPVMMRISKANFDFFRFKPDSYQLQLHDFLNSDEKMDYIAADLPYGKNTKSISDDFYENAVKKLDTVLGKQAAIILPKRIDVAKLFSKCKNIHLAAKFDYYVHCSMSRVICLIKKR